MNELAPESTPSTVPSRPGWTDRWSERLASLANPIVVKEVRQVLRSRRFTISFTLLTVFGAVVALIAADTAGVDQPASIGRGVFIAYFTGLLFVSCSLIPVNAYYSLSQELEDGTFQLVGITGLSATAILRGKVLSTLVQTALYMSALLPFIAYAYLLRGVDLLTIFSLLLLAAIESTWLVIYALFLCASSPSPVVRKLMGVFFALGTLMGVGMVAGFAWTLLERRVLGMIFGTIIDEPGTGWIAAGGIFLLATYAALFFALGVGKIAFFGANRSTAPRLVLAVQWLGLGAATWAAFHTSGEEAGVLVFAGLMLVQAQVVTVLGITEHEKVARRLRRERARRPWWWRALDALFFPGGRRGGLFGLALGGLTVALAVAILRRPEWFTDQHLGPATRFRLPYMAEGVLTAWLYGLVYVLVPIALFRLSGLAFTPRACRAALFTLPFLTMLVPGLLDLLGFAGTARALAWLQPFEHVSDLLRAERSAALHRLQAGLAGTAAVTGALWLAAVAWRQREAKRLTPPPLPAEAPR
jgi:hypothetical protein